MGVLGLGCREFGLFSGDLALSVRQSEVFRLKTEKAGTDIGLELPAVSLLVLRVASEALSSSLTGSGLGLAGGEHVGLFGHAGPLEYEGALEHVGSDMESERSPRDSSMSKTPSLTAEDCLL